MSTAASKGKVTESKPIDFVIGKIDGTYRRFMDSSATPLEATDIVTLESMGSNTAQGMTKEMVGDLYGKLFANGITKNYKTREIAIDSFAYQVAKMPFYDPNAPKSVSKGTVTNSPGKTAAASATPSEPAVKKAKSPDRFELLTPDNVAEVVKELAPQARELALIMTEIAEEKQSRSFSSTDLEAKLSIPDVAARLKTRQSPMRILQYYKAKLNAVGLIKVT